MVKPRFFIRRSPSLEPNDVSALISLGRMAFRDSPRWQAPPSKLGAWITCLADASSARIIIAYDLDSMVVAGFAMAALVGDRHSPLQCVRPRLRLVDIIKNLSLWPLVWRVICRRSRDFRGRWKGDRSRSESSSEGIGFYIDQFAVGCDYQGKGLGRELLAACFSLAAEEQCQFIGLSVDKSNEVAKRLYARVGFRLLAETRFGFSLRCDLSSPAGSVSSVDV